MIMDEKDFSSIYNELSIVLTEGPEEHARQFLTDRFGEFPKELQDTIVLGLFEEGLEEAAESTGRLAETQTEALEDATLLERVGRMVADRIKLKELEGKLSS